MTKFIDENGRIPKAKDGVKIIEGVRELEESEFVFYKQSVITDDSLLAIFRYINDISNVKITYNNHTDFVGTKESINQGAPILVKINLK
tara:strand:+ start:1864 stop:2130 length:267 start_codon:yes stop_codon:yes gene_type:complete